MEQKKAHKAGQICHGTIQMRSRPLYNVEVWSLLLKEMDADVLKIIYLITNIYIYLFLHMYSK